MSKKLLFLFAFFTFVFVLRNIRYYEFGASEKDIDSSLIGLTIDGSSTNTFPIKDSGYAIDSINCDKGASGVWDYESWTLRIRNVTQSRTKCQINFVSKYSEGILNGTDPVLKDGLIPVTIENDGTVKKASLGWEWYKYAEQRWANVVILNNETEKYYDGDVIPESAIESYFVWIPRYKYKIFDKGEYEELTSVTNKQQMIDVVFGTDTTADTSSSCASPLVSGASGNCSVGKYMTHPAFLSFGTNGMWVGKFETGYKGANTRKEAEVNENNVSKIQIKPNVYSWRGINVSNAYLNSYSYKRDMSSHMMKNTEWGAVAYLQHSAYGSHTSVRMNNNDGYLTGYAAMNEPSIGYTGSNLSCSTSPTSCNEWGTDSSITQPWNTEIGIKASTTGNISGIYDMSGGSWDYVMAVMVSEDGIPCSGVSSNHSGFQGPFCNSTGTFESSVLFPTEKKYYDLYIYEKTDKGYQRRILGDATGEMGPFGAITYKDKNRQIGSWHADEAIFVSPYAPWFERGGFYQYGSGSGMFHFGNTYGSAGMIYTYRIVLSLS